MGYVQRFIFYVVFFCSINYITLMSRWVSLLFFDNDDYTSDIQIKT
jgi:hypothetical protein